MSTKWKQRLIENTCGSWYKFTKKVSRYQLRKGFVSSTRRSRPSTPLRVTARDDDSDIWEEAERLSNGCDVMFIVGTSLNVGPVNQLPLYAKRNGAILIEVNPEPTIFNKIMNYSVQGSATEILPQLLHL